MVTTFSFTPKKESFYACPYCLSKIDTQENVDQKISLIKQVISEEPKKQENFKDSKYYTSTENKIDKTNAPFAINVDKIGHLEKQKENLLAEIYELREKATRKIYTLEKEVTTLKQETEVLKKLLDE
jgi:hypothetical protein